MLSISNFENALRLGQTRSLPVIEAAGMTPHEILYMPSFGGIYQGEVVRIVTVILPALTRSCFPLIDLLRNARI